MNIRGFGIGRGGEGASLARGIARWTGGLALALGALAFAAGAAQAETRSLKLFFIHTKEKDEIVFKRNGRYDTAGLAKINRFLRDWRRNEPTKMDPRLLDLVWEVYRNVGGSDYIHVVSAYRSPATNGMLRSRSKGVAEKSQHMLGKAMDFYIPGVPLKKIREAGARMQVGGVGYYPTSGSPFVHLDVGNPRMWPRMSRNELASLFPDGRTLYLPTDGKPLPGYQQALASYNERKKSGTTALALASSKPTRSGGLLASLFGRGADEDEDEAYESTPAPVRAVAKPAETVKPAPALPFPEAPALRAEPPAPAEKPETIIAALPDRSVPLPVFAPRPKADVGAPVAVAAVAAAPEKVPFGVADSAGLATPAAVAAAQEQVAANIPLPTWRPDYKPQAVAAAVPLPAEKPVLMALAETPAPMAAMPLPEKRPEFSSATDAQAELVAVTRENNARLAALSTGATPRQAVLARAEGTDPTQAVGSGVKTTKKAARPAAHDTKPSAKPAVVAAQPAAARWALSAEAYVAPVGAASTSAEAHALVRSAPAEVYATGFQQGVVADASSFSGKAVSFMPMARFATN